MLGEVHDSLALHRRFLDLSFELKRLPDAFPGQFNDGLRYAKEIAKILDSGIYDSGFSPDGFSAPLEKITDALEGAYKVEKESEKRGIAQLLINSIFSYCRRSKYDYTPQLITRVGRTAITNGDYNTFISSTELLSDELVQGTSFIKMRETLSSLLELITNAVGYSSLNSELRKDYLFNSAIDAPKKYECIAHGIRIADSLERRGRRAGPPHTELMARAANNIRTHMLLLSIRKVFDDAMLPTSLGDTFIKIASDMLKTKEINANLLNSLKSEAQKKVEITEHDSKIIDALIKRIASLMGHREKPYLRITTLMKLAHRYSLRDDSPLRPLKDKTEIKILDEKIRVIIGDNKSARALYRKMCKREVLHSTSVQELLHSFTDPNSTHDVRFYGGDGTVPGFISLIGEEKVRRLLPLMEEVIRKKKAYYFGNSNKSI